MNKMLTMHPLAIAIVSSLASTTMVSQASASPSEVNTTAMETVVVTGSVIGNSEIEDVKEYPGARTIITSDQIKNGGKFD